jgi:hypothetical protein
MQQAAETGYIVPSTPAPRPLRALPIEEVEVEAAREVLLHRLAADRLRDLRDDGLTLAYVARMYGVDLTEMEAVDAELLPSRTR